MKNLKKGFTLIELLVVVAIIGILSAVVLTSLGSSNVKAKVSSAQKSMKSAQSSANICVMNDALSLSTPTVGSAMCTGSSAKWPKLPTGWSYGSVTSSPTAATFSFSATGDSKTVTCTQTGCSVS